MAYVTYALEEGENLKNRYVIKGVLGRGGFGITYEAYDSANCCRCAIKEYFPRDVAMRLPDGRSLYQMTDGVEENYKHGQQRFKEEAKVLRKLQGVESVVCVYDHFDENNTSYFVMEYIEGVTLKKLVKENGRLSESVVRSIFFDIGTGLIQVHGMGIFHRDIKPDNIMLTSDGKAKLIDFGNAKNLRQKADEGYSIMLTPKFAPPEQYQKKSEQGTWTDVYSFASTMFYALTGNMIPEPMERYSSGEYINMDKTEIPYKISEALNNALKLDYKKRTQSIHELLDELGWFRNGGQTLVTYSTHVGNLIGYMDGKPPKPEDESKWNHITVIENQNDGNAGEEIGDEGNTGRVVEEQSKYPVSQKATPCPYIVIISGDNAGSTIILPLDRAVIVGRTKNYAQIIFEQDEYISKKHCEIYYDSIEDEIYITDYSTNGTWVNGYKLEPKQIYWMDKGSVVVLANQICSFKVGVTYQ